MIAQENNIAPINEATAGAFPPEEKISKGLTALPYPIKKSTPQSNRFKQSIELLRFWKAHFFLAQWYILEVLYILNK